MIFPSQGRILPSGGRRPRAPGCGRRPSGKRRPRTLGCGRRPSGGRRPRTLGCSRRNPPPMTDENGLRLLKRRPFGLHPIVNYPLSKLVPASRAEFRARLRLRAAVRAEGGSLPLGLLRAAARAEGHARSVVRAAGALPAARGLLRLLGLLLLHLLLVGGGERARHAARGVHAEAHAHEGRARARFVAARGLDAARHGALHVTLAHARV